MHPDAPIRYFAPDQPYFEFCNFSPHGFILDEFHWKTVEHYFQAQKFPGHAYQENIRQADTPQTAKALGQTRRHPLRGDWEQIKEETMLRALRAKFSNPSLAAVLLSTENRELVEDSEDDPYWARGRDGTGRNRAGELLMQVRTELRHSCRA